MAKDLRIRWLVWVILLASTPLPSASAQNGIEPFSELDLKINLGKNLSSDRLFESWSSPLTGAVEMLTPFYAGYASLGIQIESFQPRIATLPSYISAYPNVGWQLRWSARQKVVYDTGFRLGMFFMAFDSDASSGVRNESELAYSLFQNVQIPVSTHLRFFVEGAYSKVFTRIRMNFYHLSGGLILKLGIPEWLRSFLK